MPKPFVYRNGQVVMLRVTVVNDADLGNVVVDLGGLTMSIPQVNLDRADVRPESAREKTDEERDRTAEEDRAAKARADAEAKKPSAAADLQSP